jgi:hypothetical protein
MRDRLHHTSYKIERGEGLPETPNQFSLFRALLALSCRVPRIVWASIFCALLLFGIARTLDHFAPTYHQYFQRIIHVYDDQALALVQIDSETQAIIDKSTGREVIGFTNSGSRRYLNVWFTEHEDALIVRRTVHNQNLLGQSQSWVIQDALIHMHTGRQIIPFGRYDAVLQAFDGMAVVETDGKRGLIETETGREIMPFIYDSIWSVSTGMVQVEIDELWGILEIETGREIMPMIFNFISNLWLEDSMVRVSIDYKKGLFEIPGGREIIPIGKYRWIYNVSGGFARVSINVPRQTEFGTVVNDEHFGIVNIHTGEKIVPFDRYDFIGHLHYGMAIVEYNDESVPWRQPTHVGLIDITDGTELIPMGMFDCLGGMFVSLTENMVTAESDGKVGLIDVITHNEIIIFGRYDDIRLFSGGYAAVLQGGQWQFIRISCQIP